MKTEGELRQTIWNLYQMAVTANKQERKGAVELVRRYGRFCNTTWRFLISLGRIHVGECEMLDIKLSEKARLKGCKLPAPDG